MIVYVSYTIVKCAQSFDTGAYFWYNNYQAVERTLFFSLWLRGGCSMLCRSSIRYVAAGSAT